MAVFLDFGVAGILLGQVLILVILGVIMFRGSFLSGANISPRAVSLSRMKEFALYGFPAAAANIALVGSLVNP